MACRPALVRHRIDRVASETPSALVPHTAKIVAIAEDGSLPHVLIKAFAKDAALRLLIGPPEIERKIPEDSQRHQYQPRSKAKNADPTQPEFCRREDTRLRFRSLGYGALLDEFAIDVFADVSLNEFLDVAERWIVDEWKTRHGSSRWDLHPRKNRFSERNWVQSSNDHGSEPILERFSTYLERLAMSCAVGELMRTRPLAAPSAGSEDEMESWLRRRGLV